MSEQQSHSIRPAFEKALGRGESSGEKEFPSEQSFGPELPVFHLLLTELRSSGVPVTTGEFLDLQTVMGAGNVHSLQDLYPVARAVLVKDVTHYDTYDVVFSRLFAGHITPDIIEPELDEPADDKKNTTVEDKIEAKESPKEENKSKTIVEEPGTTENNHGGDDAHKEIAGSPATTKDGGLGKPKISKEERKLDTRSSRKRKPERLEKRVTKHQFKAFDKDEILNSSQFERVLSRLTTIIKQSSDVRTKQIDVRQTVQRISRNGGLPDLVYKEEEEVRPRMILLFDVGGSTDEFRPIIEQLFKAATESMRDLEVYYFHNAIYGEVWRAKDGNWGKNFISMQDVLHDDPETKVLIVGDANMGAYDSDNGGLHDSADDLAGTNRGGYYGKSGYENFQAIAQHFSSAVWINPIKEKDRSALDDSETMLEMERVFPTYELTLNGLEKAVADLMHE